MSIREALAHLCACRRGETDKPGVERCADRVPPIAYLYALIVTPPLTVCGLELIPDLPGLTSSGAVDQDEIVESRLLQPHGGGDRAKRVPMIATWL